MIEFNKIWVEKYRPNKLADVILDEASLRVVSQFEEEIPNLLFVGNPGTGKTTLEELLLMIFLSVITYTLMLLMSLVLILLDII